MVNHFSDEEETHEPLIRWITFQLGSEVYGVEVRQVREILRINNILPVPGAPDYILGITNIRGNVVSVIDGRQRLNLPTIEYTASSRMVVLESETDIVAVVVDRVADIIDFPESSVGFNPKIKSGVDSKYVLGVISHEGGLIIALSTEKFISDEQFDMAAGF